MSWVLRKPGGTYWFRRAVPAKLRPIVQKRELLVSLNTKDAAVAKKRAVIEAAKADRLLDEARKSLENPAVHLYKTLQADAEERLLRPRSDDAEDAEALALTDAIERTADPKEQAILQAILKRVTGKEEDSADNPPLSLLFDRWRAERQPPSRTWLEWTKARERFESVAGDLPVRGVTKAHVRAFKDALIRTTRRHGDVPLSPASIQKNLAAVRSVFSWAVSQGYLEANPADGITHAGVKRTQARRLPYDADDLKKLFSREACGARKARPADHWLPLLALYTGARLEELGQLRVEDVNAENGTPYVFIRSGDGRRIKTRSSERRIPLHPKLIRLGFLAYVEERRKAGDKHLFPDLKTTPGRPLTAMWSKYWGRHARKVCGIKDKAKTFHSFRHAFVDAAREVMPEEHRHAITGHSGGGVGRTYGTGVPLRVLSVSIAKVSFPVNLSHLVVTA